MCIISKNNRSSAYIRRGILRFGSSVFIVVVFLVLLSPFVVRLIEQRIHRIQLENAQSSQALMIYMLSSHLPNLSQYKCTSCEDFNYWNSLFNDALKEIHVDKTDRVTIISAFKNTYHHAEWLLGKSQAHIWVRLLILEMRAETRDRKSLFQSPEEALVSSQRWLTLIHAAFNAPVDPRNSIFVNVLAAATPSLSAPEIVASNSRDILSAAHLTHLSPGLLAAIVDNEQAGAKLVYGLSGGVRQMAANIAQHEAATGNSGMWRYLSHNLGLTQMSWEDAEKQGPRLRALGLSRIPVPHNEFEARQLLKSPRLNILFAACRLRGYLNVYYNKPSNDISPYTDAWLYILGPGWHNRPKWMADAAVWNYTWNGFFKAVLYERLLPKWAK